MNEREEEAYVRGSQAAWLRMALVCLSELPARGTAESWRIERAQAIAMLRQVCEHHGDNDWPDDLHLADVIEKHLWRHLEER